MAYATGELEVAVFVLQLCPVVTPTGGERSISL